MHTFGSRIHQAGYRTRWRCRPSNETSNMAEGQKSGPSEDEYQGQISSIQQIFAEHLGGYYWLAMRDLKRGGFELIVTDLVST